VLAGSAAALGDVGFGTLALPHDRGTRCGGCSNLRGAFVLPGSARAALRVGAAASASRLRAPALGGRQRGRRRERSLWSRSRGIVVPTATTSTARATGRTVAQRAIVVAHPSVGH
jgi:hypothetical protein